MVAAAVVGAGANRLRAGEVVRIRVVSVPTVGLVLIKRPGRSVPSGQIVQSAQIVLSGVNSHWAEMPCAASFALTRRTAEFTTMQTARGPSFLEIGQTAAIASNTNMIVRRVVAAV